jgi:hypothetical protein
VSSPKASARRTATLSDLKTKQARTSEIVLPLGDELVTIVVKSINTKVYDDLIGLHPPTKKDKEDGASFDLDTFGPALMALCTKEPELTEDEALEIWASPDWARGELLDWFSACVNICNKGLEVPSTANGSGSTRRSTSR